MGNAFTPFAGFFQHGYVTTDIAQAVEIFGSLYGVKKFLVRNPQSVVFHTRNGAEPAELRLAFAYVGDTQIEIIQPLGGPGARVHQAYLPTSGFGLTLHHLGYRVSGPVTEWERFRATVGNDTYPIAIEGDTAVLKFLYLDTRPTLGHYSEYIWSEIDTFADVPRN